MYHSSQQSLAEELFATAREPFFHSARSAGSALEGLVQATVQRREDARLASDVSSALASAESVISAGGGLAAGGDGPSPRGYQHRAAERGAARAEGGRLSAALLERSRERSLSARRGERGGAGSQGGERTAQQTVSVVESATPSVVGEASGGPK